MSSSPEQNKPRKVSFDEIQEHEVCPQNLYIALQDGRFLLVLRKDAAIDRERLQKYVDRGVNTFYFSDQLPETIQGSNNEPTEAMQNRIVAIEKISHVVFEDIRAMGISEEAFNRAKSISKFVVGVIGKDPQLSDAFDRFGEMSHADARHGVMVSAMSVILCTGMDWVKPSTYENLALAGMLHDIGLLVLPEDIRRGRKEALSPNDQRLFNGHPEAGRSFLAQLKIVPDDVCMAVAHHHERSDGSGYPVGLKDIYIHPLAKIVGLANELVENYEKDRQGGQEPSARTLVEGLLNNQSSKFNRDIIKALKGLIQSKTLAS